MSLLDIARLGLRIDARQVREGDRALNDFTRSGERAERATDRANAAMKRMAQVAAAVASALALAKAVQLADEMALLDARLKLTTKSMQEFAEAQRDVYDIAQKNAVSIASVTALYTKLADPIREVGGGMKEIKGIVDAFSMSLRISGASTAEASASIMQFAQAMAAGRLNGDEFRSLAEASPRFMKALAEGMGVPIGQLKNLGAEGKLTADIVGNALLKSITKLNEEAKTLPETVGGAFVRMKNDIAVSLRDINQLKITGGLASMIDEVRKLVPIVKDELVAAFTAVNKWIEANRDKLAEVWKTTKDVLGDVWELGKAAAAVVGFIVQWAVQSGALKTVLETIRFMIAGFQDGVLLIGAGFAKIGSIIMESVLKPMNVMGKVAASIMEVFDPERAAALRASMKAANDFAGAGGKYFDEVMDRFARGDTAVGKLDRELSGVKVRTDAAAKAADKAADSYKNLEGKIDPKDAAKEAEKAAKARAKALKEETDARDERNDRELAYNAALSAADQPLQDRIDAARKEAEQNEELARYIGLTTLQIEQRTLADLQGQLAQAASLGYTEREIAVLKELIGLKQRNVTALGTIGTGNATSEPQKLLDIMEALDDAARSASQGMADAFGSMGSAIGDLTTALTGYQRTQAAIAAQMDATIKGGGNADKARADAARQSAQAQLKSYGDMAKAAKGFFKENSAGYRAMEGAEKAYRAFEMALAVKSMIEKSGLLTAFTSLFVASKATETAATVASVGPDVAASLAKGQAAAAAAVAKQAASGPPQTAWIQMAAMAAAMAALGFAVSGGSKGDTTAKDRQAATGTGSVLGDSSAKSQSIARAIELSAQNSNIELSHTAGMLRALLSIESNIGNLGGTLARSGVNGKVPSSVYGSAEQALSSGFAKVLSPFGGKILGAIFGGKTSAIDTGVMTNKTTVAGARAGGLQASKYTDMKKEGGWFSSDKYYTDAQKLDATANQQFGAAFGSMADSIRAAGGLLGIRGDAFNQELDSFVIDLGKISAKDLSAEEFQKQLEAAFSKVGDDMAAFAVGGLQQFQQVGEGYLETLVRVANNYANLDSVLASVGMTFGATGMNSIAARENLIALAGGIDELASKTQSFGENFLSEAERLAPVQKYVADQLAAMGLSALDSRDKFKQYVLALDLTNPAMQEQYAALMDLQAAFAKTHAATKDLTKSEQAIADERADLQATLDDLVMSTVQKIEKARAALDPTNRALFDQVQAAQAARDAQDEARDSLQGLADEYRGFAKGLEAFGLSLVTGNLSTLTTAQQEAQVRKQYEQTEAAALAGDKTALGNYEKVAAQFLALSQKANGGDSKYMSDYARVFAMTDKLASYATDRADLAMMQLDAAERSARGIEELIAIIRTSEGTLQSLATRAPVAPVVSGTAGTYAQADDVKSLIEELKAQAAANGAQAAELARLQALENNRVTLASADKIVGAVERSTKVRATADNTTATLDA